MVMRFYIFECLWLCCAEEHENAPFDTGVNDALLLSIDDDAIEAVSESEDELDDLSEIKLHDTQYDGETRLHVVARCQQLRVSWRVQKK